MSYHTFYYPTQATATSTLIWNTHAHLVDDSDVITFNDELDTAKGGTDYVRDYGDAIETFHFTGIVPRTKVSTETDKADVASFLKTVKRNNTFSWVDTSSVTRTVRIMNNPITLEPFAGGNCCRINLELKVQ